MCACASTKPGTTVRAPRSTTRVRRPHQRSAWASVPTATKQSPRTARARAQVRSGRAVKILPPTRTTSASPGMSPHVPQALDPRDRLPERLVLLREHEPDEPLPVLGVPVERTARDDRDSEPFDEVHRERPVVGERERGEVRHDVVRAGRRSAVEARRLEAADEGVPLLLIRPRELAV